jgi:hypothetical protein
MENAASVNSALLTCPKKLANYIRVILGEMQVSLN